jgi:hypothetical protein
MQSLARSLLLLFAVNAFVATGYAQDAAVYRGRSLEAVLNELRADGAPLVYSSNLVPSSLAVVAEPTATDLRTLLGQLLAPHGLALRESAGVWLVVRAETPPPVAVRPGSVIVNAVSAATGEALVAAVVQLDAPSGPSAAMVAGRSEFRELTPGRHVLTVRAAGYLPERIALNVTAGATATSEIALLEAVPRLEELTVTASRYDLVSDVQPSASYFSRDEIETLSELGGDALRVAHRLPGIAAGDFSARSHVRGGAADEMTVLLDGMRLIEPYHLRDYQGVFSAIDQRIVAGMQIYSGGFPAAYGDALSGLTVIDPREPTGLRHELGLSLFYTSALSSGVFADGRGQWLVSVRRGNLDRLLNEELGEPSYHDSFVRVGFDVGARHRLVLNNIGFDDDILLTPDNSLEHRERGLSNTDVNQLWLKLESDWSTELASQTVLYAARFVAERLGAVDDLDAIRGAVSDQRTLQSRGVKQDWQWNLSERQLLSFGAEAERLEASYRYLSAVEQRGVLGTLGSGAPATRDHSLTPLGKSYSAYVSDRVRITERLIGEIGVRWDKQTYLRAEADEQFSPRSSLLYRLGAQTDVRLSYGRFFQAEGLLDLQVEDGVLDFAAAQRASHSIVGIDHRFDSDLALRVEVFRKWTREARPRFENLFDPLELMPELRPGRVRVAPERAEARGLEVLVNGELPAPWWFGYSLARVEDVIGGVRVPRGWDQRHAVNGGVSWDVGLWNMSVAGSFHSGWPATRLTLETVAAPGGGITTVAVAGERNADRMGWYRRIDYRASRTFAPQIGSLRLFAEVLNVTDQANACCVGYDIGTTPLGMPTLTRVERDSLPVMINLGLLWEF